MPGAPAQPEPAQALARPTSAGSAAPGTFDAVILAGGRATRLGGVDKIGLTVGGSTLVAAVVAAAVAADAQRVVLVGPPRTELLPLTASLRGGLIVVSEDPPGCGPVPALRCGLACVDEPRVAVLAADLPFLRGDHLRALLTAVAEHPAGAVLIDDEGRPQWLAGCWRTESLRSALRDYRGGSLHGLLEPLHPVLLGCHDRGQPPPWLDCDTARELDLARHWQQRAAR